MHTVAEAMKNSKLATCCPILHYGPGGPVVTLLCSGSELVKAVGWRRMTSAETTALRSLAASEAVETRDLHPSWHQLQQSGLTWDLLIFAGIVTYVALDGHVVLKEKASEDFFADGLTFYKISVEMESSIRTLQTEDAATGPMGHPVRVGYSVGLALASHQPAPLSGGRSTTSDRSAGLGPDPANIRCFIGNTPGGHYSSTLRHVAVLHDWGARTQEDSIPLDIDSLRHDVFQHFTNVLKAASHHSLRHCSHREELQAYLQKMGVSCHAKVAECLDDATGLVKKAFTFVERGQAICFIPKGKLSKKGDASANIQGSGKPPAEMEQAPLLHLAECDMWVKSIEARASDDER